MYLPQTSGVSDCQNFKTPSFNSPKVLGLCVVCRNCFKDPQRYSIGLRSGLLGGVAQQFYVLSFKVLLNIRASVLWVIAHLEMMPIWKTFCNKCNKRGIQDITETNCIHYPNKHNHRSCTTGWYCPPTVKFCRMLGARFKLLRLPPYPKTQSAMVL